MPRVASKKQTLAALTGDMSDDELAHTQFGKNNISEMPTPDSATENKAAAAKKMGRPTRKTKAASTASTTAKSAASKPAPKQQRGKRPALEDLTNINADSAQLAPASKRAKTTKRVASKAGAQDNTLEDISVSEVPSLPAVEALPDAEDISESIEHVSPQRKIPAQRRQPVMVRSQSQSRIVPRANSRAISSERGVGDAALRRKLGDLTSKYDSLEVRYTQLKETASIEGQSNFEKLKVATDKHSKTQDNLIAALRKQLAAQTDLANEVRKLRAQVTTAETEKEQLQKDKDISLAEVKDLKQGNLKSQNEIKTLQAKLAASRAHADPAAQAKGKAAPSSTSSALASLKEDLYCDVTGLLIHNVKKTDRRTVYDCSQTGRNGTLRFQFTMEEVDLSTLTPGASVFEDTQVTYTPLLDERNDQQLYDILADYLLEEIEFPRNSLMKLYTSIRDGMTKAVVVQDDDDSSRDEE